MTERVANIKKLLLDRQYRKARSTEILDFSADIPDRSVYGIFTAYLQKTLEQETPLFYGDDIFGFNRSHTHSAICRENGTDIYPSHIPCNVTPDYMLLMKPGLAQVLADIRKMPRNPLREAAVKVLELILDFSDRYQQAAKEAGNQRLYDALCNVPRNSPSSFYEACLFQKILIYMLRITKHDHITLGRFDQYMYPYFRADLERGVSEEALFETLELYFLSLNLDTDTYLGLQAGDNGQSMVLGGFDAAGNSVYNTLSRLCMEASLELEVIDPKINLRVSSRTPEEHYRLGTKLTKKSLGFPQYCNDDIVVPGLIKLGYTPEDAIDYTVAACWEYIIPGKGADIPNVTAMNFPLVIRQVIDEHLADSPDFETLMGHVEQGILRQIEYLTDRYNGLEKLIQHKWCRCSPLMSLLVRGCMESGKDFARFGAQYYNLGCHGAGISTAADSLAAVKKMVYDDRLTDPQTLLTALEQNFEGFTSLRNQLLACPKMGSDDDYVDSIAGQLMDYFAKHLNGRPNGLGGIWRAGTGSAMEYVRCGKVCPATPDGRLAGTPFACSFSPSLQAKPKGPLSTIRSFTKFDLTNIINGGPLTMELHDNVFRNEEGEEKVAALVKLFVLSGGHQLQLNTLNRQQLLDARAHPENYPNLVVRVWGWSGYFRELDPEYQDHILQRTQFTV